MSREDIIAEIERLRTRLYDLVDAGANYGDLILASQELDKYIVMYHTAARFDSHTIRLSRDGCFEAVCILV